MAAVSLDRNASWKYSCFGLTMASAIELPELEDGGGASGSGEPDVRISYGSVLADGLSAGRQIGPFLWVDGDRLWLRVPDVARYCVSGGSSIVVAPEAGADDDSVRAFLLSSGFAALLYQRRLLVLHGNAVAIGDRCLVCVGPSGSGKSTLAAALMKRGHRILADDVVPVDADGRVLPGLPRIKLWEDTAARLDIETAGLRLVRPALRKYNLPVGRRSAAGPLPVRWVYVLGTHASPETRFEALTGLERFRPLRENTFRVRYMEGMALDADHLRLCGALAGRVHLARLLRPQHGFDVEDLVDRILDDIAANP
jgi:hypothetical protein